MTSSSAAMTIDDVIMCSCMHVYSKPVISYLVFSGTCNIGSQEVLKKRGKHLKLCTLISSQFPMHNTIL